MGETPIVEGVLQYQSGKPLDSTQYSVQAAKMVELHEYADREPQETL